MNHLANHGLQKDSEKYLLESVFEEVQRGYKNENVDIYNRTTNNRLLLLLEDNFHPEIIEKELTFRKDFYITQFLKK